MKKLLWIVLLFVAGACNSGKDEDAAANIETVKKYITAVESKDYEAMKALLADNYVGIGPSVNDSINKTLALENWKDRVDELYESIKYEDSRFMSVDVVEGEYTGRWVANWALVTIRYRNDGGTVKILANTMYKMGNNQIEKSYTFYNEADALEQLGYIIIHPNDLYSKPEVQ